MLHKSYTSLVEEGRGFEPRRRKLSFLLCRRIEYEGPNVKDRMKGSNAICGLGSAIRGAKESFESTFFEWRHLLKNIAIYINVMIK